MVTRHVAARPSLRRRIPIARALGARQWDRAPRRRRLRRPRRARRPSPPPNQLRRPFQKSDQLRDSLPQRQIGSHIGPAVPARGLLRVVPERALPAGDHDVLLVVAVEIVGRGERERVSSEPLRQGTAVVMVTELPVSAPEDAFNVMVPGVVEERTIAISLPLKAA